MRRRVRSPARFLFFTVLPVLRPKGECSMNTKRSTVKAYIASVVCHVFWGFSFFASRKGLDAAHVFVLLSHRFLLSFLVMSLFAVRLIRRPFRGRKAYWLLLLGLAEPVVYFFGEQYGLLHSNTIFSGVMIAMIPIVSMLLAVPFLGERPVFGQIAFSLLSVGGVVGIGLLGKSSGTMDWIGVAGLLVAVLSAGAYTLISRGISGTFSPFERTYVMMAEGAAVFTVLALIHCRGDLTEYVLPLAEPSYLTAVLFLALGCSVISYFLSGYAIGKLSVARETVFANLTTAVSVFAGAVFLREAFSWLSFLFCLLILGGIYGVQRCSPPDERAIAADGEDDE